MILELVKKTDPILTDVMPKFDFNNPIMDPSELAINLSETMLHYNGAGLAANQVGIRTRVFVIKAAPILACFNPVIVDVGPDKLTLEEGCLTYPGLFVKIQRPQVIKVRYTMANGETVTKVFQDLTARAFQHETDHLDGLRFFDRATKYHKDLAFNQARKNLLSRPK